MIKLSENQHNYLINILDRYNISSRGKPFVCICPDGEAIFYKDGKDLTEKCCINGNLIKDIWREIDIYSM